MTVEKEPMRSPEPGVSETLEPGLRRVLAPNPGPMTHWGTNTFIVGEGRIAIVDPGPENAAHFDALLQATRGETITHILVTHAHLDHSPLARRLSHASGATVLAFGPAESGRSDIMATLATQGLAGGGEGVDHAFSPDLVLGEGDVIVGDNWTVDVLHTPGHFAGHLGFRFGDAVLSGDHVMDWSSSLVSPPDGDLRAFMATSRRLRDAEHRVLHPSHGDAIGTPSDRLGWLIEHREARERQILNTLSATPQTARDIARRIYTDVPDAMLPAAERNVFAHLIDLHERNVIRATPMLSASAHYSLA